MLVLVLFPFICKLQCAFKLDPIPFSLASLIKLAEYALVGDCYLYPPIWPPSFMSLASSGWGLLTLVD